MSGESYAQPCLAATSVWIQVSVVEPEAYVFDEEVLKKAADLGKPGLVEIKQLQDKFIFRVEGTGVLPVRGGLVVVGGLQGGYK